MSINLTFNGFLLQMMRLSIADITLCVYTKTIIVIVKSDNRFCQEITITQYRYCLLSVIVTKINAEK